MMRATRRSAPFPYTTLFRSQTIRHAIGFASACDDQSQFELGSEIESATDFALAIRKHHDRHAAVEDRHERRQRSIRFWSPDAARIAFVDLHRFAITLRVKHHLS